MRGWEESLRMQPFEPACLASGIGSLPHRDAAEACRLVLENFRAIPFWPQLPMRSPHENMYAQFAGLLPGLTEKGSKLVIDTGPDFEVELGKFYERYLACEQTGFPLDIERAEGFFSFLEWAAQVKPKPDGSKFFAVKGQVTGPISFGLSVTDKDNKPILYNDFAMDAVAKNIAMMARWQEDVLAELATPIMFFDEPFMSTYGSAFFNYGADLVEHYLELATEGVKSLTAVHCCANTDWGLLLDSHISIISFDAYGYADKMLLYADALGDFLQRGGALAVGIVPAVWEDAQREDEQSLLLRLESFYDSLGRRGLDPSTLAKRTLLTPSCGLGSQPLEGAVKIVETTAELSRLARERFGLTGKETI